jgi:hypothetical protein
MLICSRSCRPTCVAPHTTRQLDRPLAGGDCRDLVGIYKQIINLAPLRRSPGYLRRGPAAAAALPHQRDVR